MLKEIHGIRKKSEWGSTGFIENFAWILHERHDVDCRISQQFE